MAINSQISLSSNYNKYQEERAAEFSKNLTEIVNEHIIPKYGKDLNFSIQLGLWTSDEYGSYKIPFYDKNDNDVCYVIADVIIGEWKLYEYENKSKKNS